MKRKNRVLCLLLGTALLASVLAGCGSSGINSGGSADVSQPQTETQENEPETSQTA